MRSNSDIVTITLNPALDQTIAIPDFAAGRVNRVKHCRWDAGGKGVNVAAFLADYGLPVTATGFLGRENSNLFDRLFEQKQIADRFVRIDGSTRTGIKIIDEVKQETTDINFPGQMPTPADMQRILDVIAELGAQNRWFVIAGSIPAGVSADIYQKMITAIAKTGGQVALDTSGEGFRKAVRAVPALVKPNIDELREFCGQSLNTQAEVIAAARKLLDQGVQTVVVSMGEKGALFVEKEGVVQAVPPQVPVRSTVGAGDAMLSGLVAGKIESRSLSACARLATAFAVIAVTRIGAGLGPATPLESIQCQVQLAELKG